MARKKAKAKKAAVVNTTLGEQAYVLGTAHRPQLEPRLPTGTIDDLGADLKTLGVILPPAQPALPPAQPPPIPQPPSLAEALAKTTNLVTAIHDAVRAAKPDAEVRKAYGAGSRAVGKEVKLMLASAQKVISQATANASEALALGILPADVTALMEAVTELSAAEAHAQAKGGKAGPTGKEKQAAATRMHASVERIAAAGALAFAQDAAVRAQFEALRPKKKG